MSTTPPPKPIGLYEEIGAAVGRLLDRERNTGSQTITRTERIMDVIYSNGAKPPYLDFLVMSQIIDKFLIIEQCKNTPPSQDAWTHVARLCLLMNQGLTESDRIS